MKKDLEIKIIGRKDDRFEVEIYEPESGDVARIEGSDKEAACIFAGRVAEELQSWLENIREEENEWKRDKRDEIPTFDFCDEIVLDEICAEFEHLDYGEISKVQVWSESLNAMLLFDVQRDKDLDIFDIVTSIRNEDGSYTVIDDDMGVHITELYAHLEDIIEYNRELSTLDNETYEIGD